MRFRWETYYIARESYSYLALNTDGLEPVALVHGLPDLLGAEDGVNPPLAGEDEVALLDALAGGGVVSADALASHLARPLSAVTVAAARLEAVGAVVRSAGGYRATRHPR